MMGAGLIAGLLGIGAGALKVLIHDLVMGLPPKVSTTTSNLIIGVTALAGTSVYLAAGLIDPGLAAPIILGIVVGAFIGTRVLVRLRNETVRRFFLVVLLRARRADAAARAGGAAMNRETSASGNSGGPGEGPCPCGGRRKSQPSARGGRGS